MSIYVEMEDLKNLQGFSNVRNGTASGGKYLQADANQKSSASYSFTGQDGQYDFDLSYYDENDGEGQISIFVNDTLVHSWILDKDLGSALANNKTLTNEIIKLELKSNDVIRIEGKSDGKEGLRLDNFTLNRTGDLSEKEASAETTRIEAENMSYEGFVEKSHGGASNDAYIQAKSNNASVSTSLKSEAGVYNITLNYFDENDGESEMSLVVDGQVIETWTWDQQLGSRLANDKTLTSRTFENIELKEGAKIEFVGSRDGKEPLRVDSMDLTRISSVQEQKAEALSVELEDFTKLINFKDVFNKTASGSEFVQVQNKGQTAKAILEFDGQDGDYDIVIHHYDENDGKSEMTLRIDGVDVHNWTWDKDLGHKLANSTTLTTETVEGINLSKDSVVELVGRSNGGEPLRVDKIDFVPTRSIDQDTNTPNPTDQGPSLPPTANEDPKQGPAQAPSDNTSPKVIVTSSGDPADVKAFAGAEGFGADSVGGRGGKIVHVTNLKNSGLGSLREALEDVDGPRIVVFDVEGRIDLRDEIVIKEPFITIAGQTAPGEGVVVTGARVKIETNDVIMRGMKIRPGDESGGDQGKNRDSVSVGDGGEDIIIDHNSFTWAVDETVAVWGATENITISNNIIAESLWDSIHIDEGKSETAPHGFGLIVGNKRGEDNSTNITVTKNLFASNGGRNPNFKQVDELEFTNNYISNYGYAHQGASLGGGDAPLEISFKGNYYEDGKDTNSREERPAIDIRHLEKGSQVYLDDNFIEGHMNDQTHGKEQYLVNKETFKSSDTEILSAADTKNYVLNNVGARVNGELDVVDSRILKEVKNGSTEIIDSQKEVGGYNVYDFDNNKVQDTDRDGMADWFEKKYEDYGFDYKKADDKGDYDNDGYTNIEEYINGLITGFDFGSQGDIYGTDDAETFKIVDSGSEPVHIYNFDAKEDSIDITDVLKEGNTTIDNAISNFVIITKNENTDKVSIGVDKDGSKNGRDMEVVAIIESTEGSTDIDITNIVM